MITRSRRKNHLLAAALARCGKTARAVSTEIGVHELTISRLLNCRHDPSPKTARQIAQALETTPAGLGWDVEGDA